LKAVEEVAEEAVLEESEELDVEDLEKLLADSSEEAQPELAMDAVENDILKDGTEGNEEVALDDLVSQIVEQDDELSEDADSDAELEELLAGDDMEEKEAPEESEEITEELETDLEENELIADLEKDIQDFMLDEDLDVEVDDPETNIMEEEPAVETEEDLGTELDALDDLDLGDLSAQEAPQPPVAEEKPPVIDGDRKTVLVVDDSVVIRKMIEIALENDPFNVVAAPTGKEALTKVDEEEISVIILDLILPDLNGLDVLKAVKASSDIPVIILTGKDAPKEIQKAKEQGADDFLTKPFKDEDLVSKVKELAV